MSMNPYEVLGVKRNAKDASINAAYKELAKRYHPDMPTGDAEKFLEAKRARDILTNVEMRRQYDATGELPDGENAVLMKRACHIIDDAFCDAIMSGSVEALEQTDVVNSLKTHFKKKREELRQASRELAEKTESLRAYKSVIDKRMSKKKKAKTPGNVFQAAINGMSAKLTAQCMQCADMIAVYDKVLLILDDYDFEAAEKSMYAYIRVSTTV